MERLFCQLRSCLRLCLFQHYVVYVEVNLAGIMLASFSFSFRIRTLSTYKMGLVHVMNTTWMLFLLTFRPCEPSHFVKVLVGPVKGPSII